MFLQWRGKNNNNFFQGAFSHNKEKKGGEGDGCYIINQRAQELHGLIYTNEIEFNNLGNDLLYHKVRI